MRMLWPTRRGWRPSQFLPSCIYYWYDTSGVSWITLRAFSWNNGKIRREVAFGQCYMENGERKQRFCERLPLGLEAAISDAREWLSGLGPVVRTKFDKRICQRKKKEVRHAKNE